MGSPDSARIAILAAYAIALHGLERLIPTPIPWLRFGFANIITLTTLILFGLKPALTVTFLRIFIGSILTGTFLGPAFVLSLSGGVVSTLGMGVVYKVIPSLFSPFGISIIGAVLHNIGQLIVAYLLFIKSLHIVILISPILLLTGTMTGALNGLISSILIERLKTVTRQSTEAGKGGDPHPS